MKSEPSLSSTHRTALPFRIEITQEEDGQWIAEVLALRIIAERIEHGELAPEPANSFDYILHRRLAPCQFAHSFPVAQKMAPTHLDNTKPRTMPRGGRGGDVDVLSHRFENANQPLQGEAHELPPQQPRNTRLS